MNIIENSNIEPPALKLEILKNGKDVSVYGFVPENFNKVALINSLQRKVDHLGWLESLLNIRAVRQIKIGQSQFVLAYRF